MKQLIDFHTHILPQVDDGSASLEMSLEMLRREAAQGVEGVVATSHFYARQDTPDRFLQRRAEAERLLREAMTKEGGLPALQMGAEVAFYSGMSESEILPELCIRGTKYILVEMPMSQWTEAMYEELWQIRNRQGLTPIVAHVDRYLGPFQVNRIMNRLAELPVLVQMNASFLLRKNTARTALRLLREERIHLLGSDCHNLDTRAPNMGEAAASITAHLGASALGRISDHAQTIWNG